ncbi:hypothetical protein [Limimaricola pyoseonensis]|uniref:Mercury ion transport protein n=1 Tax=Limimaricola pyoseonensis TaxID=521013 RepID=A0A1G7A451_9RHOB|nr:hypothetical protein [Limimaricola pyoseonensis]SDE08666.1 hypothetical protein SAMN04488567_0773 [Limimaricola pyoseonensis]
MTAKMIRAERLSGGGPDGTGRAGTVAGLLGTLAMTSACVLPLVPVSLGVTGFVIGQHTALKRIDTVEVAQFVAGEAEDDTHFLRYDAAATDREALIAVVMGVGHDAALHAGTGS